MKGTYRILFKGVAMSYYVYFNYRTVNGVMERKQRNILSAKWEVCDGIPEGAELVN